MTRYCTTALLIISLSAKAAPEGSTLQKGYYIVVAAYLSNQESFAQRYSSELNQAGHHSQYGFDAVRNLHYVYLDYFTDFNESINKMLEVRKQAGFSEAWVRIIKEGEPNLVSSSIPSQSTQPQAAQKEIPTPAEVKTDPTKVTPTKQEPALEPAKQEPIKPQTPQSPSTEVIPNPTADPVYIPQTLKNTQAFLSLYNATNNELIDGEVEVVDAERSRLILKAKGNQYLILPDPKSKSGKLLLIGNAFGFRKIQQEINYYDTEKDTISPDIDLVGNYYLVRFEMVRLHKGDIAVLYNVYFYNDAAVMLPESKYELNKILVMLNENPNYKITLHGHTNGNSRGKIIRVGPSQDFFDLRADDVVTENVSAKELSGARAQVIKDWLVSQGIKADRVLVKAWGGTRMLHDKDSQHARRNVRVEIEVNEE